MNFFNFLNKTIEFASQGFGNFIVSFLLIGMIGVVLVAITANIVKFRLFNINKSDNSPEEKIIKVAQNQPANVEQASNIYDMLVDAYDRYKNKKNSNDSSEDKS